MVAASILALLTSCSTRDGSSLGIQDIISDVQPSVVEYSPETQRRAAQELRQCGECPTVRMMLSDYHTMREQAREARGEAK